MSDTAYLKPAATAAGLYSAGIRSDPGAIGGAADLLMDLAAGRATDTEVICEAALELDCDHPGAKQMLGRIRAEQGRPNEAKVLFQHAEAWLDLSVVLSADRNYQPALEAARKAIASNPVAAHYQIMAIYWELGEWDAMHAALLEVLKLDPDHAMAHVALGQWKLAHKDFSGFADCEFRPWARAQKAACDEFPEWDGRETLEGRALLVLWQDGLGDQVMYARFLNYLAKEASRVVLLTQPELARVFAESFPKITVVGTDTEIGDVDCWIGMASLGKCDFPINAGKYLFCPENRVRHFASLLKPGNNPRVGLCWAGNPEHTQDRNRSLPFDWFRNLLDIEGVDFYSLQFGPENAQHAGVLNDLSRHCMDVADTAAAIQNLDLVISVDTAVVHIAGAMGTPVWVLTRTPSDWRWERKGEKSYWYDSATIFRDASEYRICGRLDGFVDEFQSYRILQNILVDPVRTVDSKYGAMRVFSNDLYCGRSLIEYGEWSDGEMELLRKIITPQSVVIEAGANIGAHTLALRDMAKQVLAFEPQPEAFALLAANLADNLGNRKGGALTFNTALGEAHEYLYCTPADTKFVHNNGRCPLEATGSREIPVAPLDYYKFLGHIDLIKADVEGSEAALLRGARKTIARCRPVLYLENDRPEKEAELLALIDELGYRIYSHKVPLFNPNNFRGNKLNVFGMLQSTMLLCVPRERYDLRPVTKTLQRVRVA